MKHLTTIDINVNPQNIGDYREEIESSKKIRIIGVWEAIGWNYFFSASVSKKLDICVATTEELTGGRGTWAEVIEAIERIGGKKCPPEVGLELRRQYLGQPEGEQLLLAMDDVPDFDSIPCVSFSLYNSNDELVLRGIHEDCLCTLSEYCECAECSQYPPDTKWAFICPPNMVP
jgi:hypothetical protein